jgi:hypothetical protein
MTPGGGRFRFHPKEFDRYLGTLWKRRRSGVERNPIDPSNFRKQPA